MGSENSHDERIAANECAFRYEPGLYGKPLVCGRKKGHDGVHIDFARFQPRREFGNPGTKSVAFTSEGVLPGEGTRYV